MGFDGGGTKTDCVLMDDAGTILSRARSGPSNPSRVALELAAAALMEAAQAALNTAGKCAADVCAIYAGIAGVGAAEAIPEITRRLQSAFPCAAVTVETDLNVSLAATGEIPSILVIAGTGSAVIGRSSPGVFTREGGLGPILGDPGSAYDIGRKAASFGLRRHLQGETSYLGTEIVRSLHVTWPELQELLRIHADSVLPPILPVVVKAASEGDACARAILNSAAKELSELVVLVIERLDLGNRDFFIAKTGGVFGRSAFFDEHFDSLIQKIAPNARLGPLPEPVAEFAAREALKSLNRGTVKHAGD
jgi:N-acetylglucosamine kinase-like BadF-type ATPase